MIRARGLHATPQFTALWLIALVAIVGLLWAMQTWHGRMAPLANRYQELADFHSYYAAAPCDMPAVLSSPPTSAELIAEKERFRQSRLRMYHARLAEKYQHAARYPWLDLPPDPRSPK